MHPDAFLAARNMHACARDTKKFILRGEHNLMHKKRRGGAVDKIDSGHVARLVGSDRPCEDCGNVAHTIHNKYDVYISVVRPQAAHRTLSTTIGCSARRLPNLPFFSQVE
jgi:hypothetical protein